MKGTATASELPTEVPVWVSISTAHRRFGVARSTLYYLIETKRVAARPMPEEHPEQRRNVRHRVMLLVNESDVEIWTVTRRPRRPRRPYRETLQ